MSLRDQIAKELFAVYLRTKTIHDALNAIEKIIAETKKCEEKCCIGFKLDGVLFHECKEHRPYCSKEFPCDCGYPCLQCSKEFPCHRAAHLAGHVTKCMPDAPKKDPKHHDCNGGFECVKCGLDSESCDHSPCHTPKENSKVIAAKICEECGFLVSRHAAHVCVPKEPEKCCDGRHLNGICLNKVTYNPIEELEKCEVTPCGQKHMEEAFDYWYKNVAFKSPSDFYTREEIDERMEEIISAFNDIHPDSNTIKYLRKRFL